MNRLFKYGLLAAFVGFGIGVQAVTSDLGDFLRRTRIDGQVRAYYFAREYGSRTLPNQQAFSLAGLLDLHSARFLNGFSFGASFYTAQALGANDFSDGGAHLDDSLMGDHPSVNALGQAYLEYRDRLARIRAGDQVIRTPWLNDADTRVLPATYQGVSARLNPAHGMTLQILRIFRWKSRTSSGYRRDNLYYTPTYAGDDAVGAYGALGDRAAPAQGAFAAGGIYRNSAVRIDLWYYAFPQFADMVYADGDYTLKTGSGFDPFIGGQVVRQWKSA